MADAEQEILAGLWTTMDRFGFASSFRTWLYRFARNRAIDLLRREGRHRRRVEAAARAASAGAVTAAVGDPARAVEGEERRARVREALAALPVDDRALVVMKHVEDLGIAEIAAATGLPEGTVKSRLHRARARLARGLGEAEGVSA
jgi:RNA polymerase sigma-70 factor (ECF subfamily)